MAKKDLANVTTDLSALASSMPTRTAECEVIVAVTVHTVDRHYATFGETRVSLVTRSFLCYSKESDYSYVTSLLAVFPGPPAQVQLIAVLCNVWVCHHTRSTLISSGKQGLGRSGDTRPCGVGGDKALLTAKVLVDR